MPVAARGATARNTWAPITRNTRRSIPRCTLFGHGHGDHMGHRRRSWRCCPALPMYGMAEHCNDIRARMAPAHGQLHLASCRLARRLEPKPSFPSSLIPGVEVRAVKHPHSAGPLDRSTIRRSPPNRRWCGPAWPTACIRRPAREPSALWRSDERRAELFVAVQDRRHHFALGWADTNGDISGNRPVAGLGTGAEVPPVYATWPHTQRAVRVDRGVAAPDLQPANRGDRAATLHSDSPRPVRVRREAGTGRSDEDAARMR